MVGSRIDRSENPAKLHFWPCFFLPSLQSRTVTTGSCFAARSIVYVPFSLRWHSLWHDNLNILWCVMHRSFWICLSECVRDERQCSYLLICNCKILNSVWTDFKLLLSETGLSVKRPVSPLRPLYLLFYVGPTDWHTHTYTLKYREQDPVHRLICSLSHMHMCAHAAGRGNCNTMIRSGNTMGPAVHRQKPGPV